MQLVVLFIYRVNCIRIVPFVLFTSFLFVHTGLPVCPELTREHIPRARDVGHFMSITGTVIRSSLVKVLEYEQDFMCNRCKHVITLKADFEQYYSFTPPTACTNYEEGCTSTKFTCLSDVSSPATCRDYQEIKIQEQVIAVFMYMLNVMEMHGKKKMSEYISN